MQKRLAKGLDANSDSYGDENEVDYELGASDTLETGAVGTGRGKKFKRAQVAPANPNHPPCPDGFDPAKWAKMTLEEKCAHLGIEVKDWLKMTREQQMQRMHNLANDFNFYLMDKVVDPDDKKFAKGKQWHL